MRFQSAAAIMAALLLASAPLRAQTLSLDDAIRRTLDAAPQGAVAEARRDALRAARRAADTRPTPTIDVTAENFGIGGSDLNRQIQVTGTYSQRIERGGQRAARIDLVDRDLDVAGAEAVVVRLDLIQAVQRLYVEAQAAEAATINAFERVGIAEMALRDVQRRVNEARDPLYAGTRARTMLAQARVDLELAEHARDAALLRLAAMWEVLPRTPGRAPAPASQVNIEGFLVFRARNGRDELAEADLAVYAARSARARSAIQVERSRTARDPTLSAGPRILGSGDVALVAGVSLPLGNRRLNEANISRAQAEERLADAQLMVAQVERRRAILLAAARVEQARHEAEAVMERVIPGAEQTLAEVRAGYARGGFTFNDVVLAMNLLADSRRRMVEAASRYHEAGVELDRLTGRFIALAEEVR